MAAAPLPARAAHRIVLAEPHTTTLVFVGRKSRTWGFYDGAGRFIDWRDYGNENNGWNEEQLAARAKFTARIARIARDHGREEYEGRWPARERTDG